MLRKIIQIDEEKCSGCGICAEACHEGVIGMVNGKAKLLREDFCDGLGDCLPTCPEGAITFIEREAAVYNEQAAAESRMKKRPADGAEGHKGCPGHQTRQLIREKRTAPDNNDITSKASVSQLAQWPCQIKLVPVNAPYFRGAKLLIAADCTAYAYAGMHEEFMRGRVTLIGCPKLDSLDYSEKLTDIIKNNDIRSVTVIRMEVPCCGGIENAVKAALQNSGKFIPWQVITVSIEGKIID